MAASKSIEGNNDNKIYLKCFFSCSTRLTCFLSVSERPKAPSVTKYYVVYDETLELPLNVTDPEGMPVTIALIEGSPKEALIKDNILI